MPFRRALLLVVLSGAMFAPMARAHDHAEGGWTPSTGGPRLGFDAATVLGAPVQQYEIPAAASTYLAHLTDDVALGLAKEPAAYRGFTHRAGRTASAGLTGETFPVGVTAMEPTLGLTPKGVLFFVGMQVESGAYFHSILRRSTDGGRTWTTVDSLVPGTDADNTTQDPYVHVDRDTGRVFHNDFDGCAPISISDDDGETFDVTANCLHGDHQNLFTGVPPAGGPRPTGYPNIVYYCSITGGLVVASAFSACSRSLDGGITWALTGSPAFQDPGPSTGGQFGVEGFCTGAHGHGAAGPDGMIYLPRGWCGQPHVAISKDGGDSWDRVQVADNGMAVGPVNAGNAGNGQVLEEHEASVAVDSAGNVYVGWTARDHLPYVAVSRDGGRSFGKPVMVGPPGTVEGFTPFLDAGDAGRLAIVLIASRNSPGPPYCVRTTTDGCETAEGAPPRPAAEYDKTTWDAYLSVTVDALAASPTFHTARLNDPADPLARGQCVPWTCGGAMREFIDVDIADDGTPWAALSDGCSAAAGETPTQCLSPGAGLVARLVGAPALRGSAADQRPPVRAPATRRCRSRRSFEITISQPRRGRIRSVRVTLRGRRVPVRRRGSRYRARIDLRGLPAGRYAVRVRTVTSTGRTFTTTRRYRTCARR